MTIHTFHLDNKHFDMILTGKKSYEIRLFDQKRRRVSLGDTIRFLSDGKDIVNRRIIGVRIYDDFESAIENTLSETMPGMTLDEAVSEYKSIHGYKEGEKEYGVVKYHLK